MCEVNMLDSSTDICGNGGLFISELHFNENGFEHQNSAVIKTSTNVTKIFHCNLNQDNHVTAALCELYVSLHVK